MSILQTIDLKKYYGTEPNITRALDGVNFSVNDGEFVAVVGTSGSGKSIQRCGRHTGSHFQSVCPWVCLPGRNARIPESGYCRSKNIERHPAL